MPQRMPWAPGFSWRIRLANGWRGRSLYLLGAALSIVLWYLITNTAVGLRQFGPVSTFRALRGVLASARFWVGMALTLERLVGGLTVAAVIGIPAGLLLGYFSVCNQLVYIPSQVLRMVSPLSWAPVSIILFGIGSGPVFFLIAISAVWPVILNTAAGVQAAEPEWLDAARCLGAGNRELFRFVLLRAALPHILVGLQLALGVAWVVVVPAEMLGVASGLGYMILDYRDVNDYSAIMALILIIGCLGLLLDWPFRKAARWAQWH